MPHYCYKKNSCRNRNRDSFVSELYPALLTVLLSLCKTERVAIRPLMTVKAMMLFSLICVAATTRHSSSCIASAPIGVSEILRL